MGDPKLITIPSSANAGSIVPLHAALLEALEGGKAVQLELEGEGACKHTGALALQLLASAERSFPSERLNLGALAKAALGTVSGRVEQEAGE